ncbi:MAG: DNA-3-methyladenine glycosylase [Candidatus Binatia bacterium]
MTLSRLTRRFYCRPTLELAPALLGHWLCRDVGGTVRRGRIVEVEAYTDDPASHARGRRRTARNAVMFGPAGHLYVYFTYGMHYCANVVADREGEPGAVLIRGLDEITGANGPGRLCRALAIDRELDGLDLSTSPVLWIARGRRRPGEFVVQTTRVGIRHAAELRWRFYLSDSRGVSRPDRRAEAACRIAANGRRSHASAPSTLASTGRRVTQ